MCGFIMGIEHYWVIWEKHTLSTRYKTSILKSSIIIFSSEGKSAFVMVLWGLQI